MAVSKWAPYSGVQAPEPEEKAVERSAPMGVNELAIGSLLRLVTGHLESPMGTLTLHEHARARPDILAALNMPQSLASRVATLLHDDLGGGMRYADGARMIFPMALLDGEKSDGRPEIPDRVTFICRVEPTVSLALSALGSPAVVDGATPRAIEAWVDLHLRLLWQMRREQLHMRAFTTTLDLLDFGILLLDRHGVLSFANARAKAMLDRGDGLRRAGHSVTAPDFDAAVRIQAAIQHLGHCIETGSRPDFGNACVILIRRPDGSAQIATLTHIAAGQADDEDGAILIHLLEPEIDGALTLPALCRAYGLTATEANLVRHLVQGATIVAAARAMRIQPLTARAYLKQVFIKTGTHRQVDLVRAMLRGMAPIR